MISVKEYYQELYKESFLVAYTRLYMSLGRTISPLVMVYFFQPKSDLTFVTSPDQQMQLMLLCIRPSSFSLAIGKSRLDPILQLSCGVVAVQ